VGPSQCQQVTLSVGIVLPGGTAAQCDRDDPLARTGEREGDLVLDADLRIDLAIEVGGVELLGADDVAEARRPPGAGAQVRASPAFVGIVYKPSSTGGGPPPRSPATARVGRIRGGTELFTVALRCPSGGAACRTASIRATATKLVNKTRKAKATRMLIVVASGTVTRAAGGHKTLTLRLTASGRAPIKSGGSITVTVKIISGAKTIQTVTVKIHKPAKTKKKRKAP
jgi:hypothetical protein